MLQLQRRCSLQQKDLIYIESQALTQLPFQTKQEKCRIFPIIVVPDSLSVSVWDFETVSLNLQLQDRSKVTLFFEKSVYYLSVADRNSL